MSTALCDYTNVWSCYQVRVPENIENLYQSKLEYDNPSFDIQVGNDCIYVFQKPKLDLTTDQTVVIDDQFTTDLKFKDTTYKGGSTIYLSNHSYGDGTLTITNEQGQTLSEIRDANYTRSLGKMIFKNESGTYIVNVGNTLTYASVQLPNVSGTFEVTYTMGHVDIPAEISGEWTEFTNKKGAVPADYPWTISFNKRVNATTLSGIFVVDSKGHLVQDAIASIVSSNNKQVVIQAPITGYNSGEEYTIYIKDTVRSQTGETISKTKMNFKVQ